MFRPASKSTAENSISGPCWYMMSVWCNTFSRTSQKETALPAKMLNIPNLLTWLRILLIPVFVLVFYLPDDTIGSHHKNLISTAVFMLASFTDWLDGYLARKLDQGSAFGAFLDPVAD